MGIKDEIRQLRHPYYIANFTLCLSYLICKLFPPLTKLVFAGNSEFEMRQTEIFFFLVMIVMIRARKHGNMTFLAYFNSSFVYAKVANTLLWFFEYKPYGLFFLFLFLLQALLLPQPTYSGPQSIVYFRDGENFGRETKKENCSWLIEFYTPWIPSCVNFASVFAEISAKYTLENLKFGKVDLSRNPEVGSQFGITDTAFTKQLPTLLLFKNGKPEMYRPLVDPNRKLVKFHMNLDNIVTTFDLNNLHKSCEEVLLKNKTMKGTTKTDNKHPKSE